MRLASRVWQFFELEGGLVLRGDLGELIPGQHGRTTAALLPCHSNHMVDENGLAAVVEGGRGGCQEPELRCHTRDGLDDARAAD
jgi:hypothetical protein